MKINKKGVVVQGKHTQDHHAHLQAYMEDRDDDIPYPRAMKGSTLGRNIWLQLPL